MVLYLVAIYPVYVSVFQVGDLLRCPCAGCRLRLFCSLCIADKIKKKKTKIHRVAESIALISVLLIWPRDDFVRPKTATGSRKQGGGWRGRVAAAGSRRNMGGEGVNSWYTQKYSARVRWWRIRHDGWEMCRP